MKITRKAYNELIKELRSMKEEMEANLLAAENAAENARRLDKDDHADRCYTRASIYSTNLKKINEVLETYDA